MPSELEGPAKALPHVCPDLICSPEAPMVAESGIVIHFYKELFWRLFQSSQWRAGYQVLAMERSKRTQWELRDTGGGHSYQLGTLPGLPGGADSEPLTLLVKRINL